MVPTRMVAARAFSPPDDDPWCHVDPGNHGLGLGQNIPIKVPIWQWFLPWKPPFVDDVHIQSSIFAQRLGDLNSSRLQDCVDGLIWSTENLARLDGYPDIKVVYRTDWSKDKVGAPMPWQLKGSSMLVGLVGDKFLFALILCNCFWAHELWKRCESWVRWIHIWFCCLAALLFVWLF